MTTARSSGHSPTRSRSGRGVGEEPWGVTTASRSPMCPPITPILAASQPRGRTVVVDETRPDFDSVWLRADRIDGWLTRPQGAVLFAEAAALAAGSTAVEIGSHQGRSTVVLAAGLSAGGRAPGVGPLRAGPPHRAPP